MYHIKKYGKVQDKSINYHLNGTFNSLKKKLKCNFKNICSYILKGSVNFTITCLGFMNNVLENISMI